MAKDVVAEAVLRTLPDHPKGLRPFFILHRHKMVQG